MRDKRIFVTGGAGVIGTALVELLLDKGAKLLVGDLKSCPDSWQGRLQYRRGDLRYLDPITVQQFAPEYIIHLAAAFERSEETPEFFNRNFDHNIALSHHLLNCIQDLPSLRKLLFASSYLVYNPEIYLNSKSPDSAVSLSENASLSPRNLCGAAKLFHEKELIFFAQQKPEIDVVSARIFRVFGLGSHDVLSRWVRAALKNETLMVYHPENLFDYIFAGDVAEGLLRLIESNFKGVVNLGSGQPRRVGDALKVLQCYFPDLRVIRSEEFASDYEGSQADITKFTEITQWKPTETLESALPKVIAYEKRSKPQSPKSGNFLITSISKKIPLISAVRQAVQKIGTESKIIGCDTNSSCIGSYAVDQFWHAPSQEKFSFFELREFCLHNGVKAIIPTRDGELPLYAEWAPKLAEVGISTLISSPEVIGICFDKYRFSLWLQEHGFPTIPTVLSVDQLAASTYVVKERYGSGARALGLNLSFEVAQQHASKLQSPVFQSLIEGKEYSIDLYRDRQGHVKGVIVRERNLIQDGESQVTTTVRKPALESLCAKMADTLQLYGHAVFQVIEDQQGAFHVIECNPRFGGASTASVAAGLDSFFWFLLEAAGESLENYPFARVTKEIRQVRFATDRYL